LKKQYLPEVVDFHFGSVYLERGIELEPRPSIPEFRFRLNGIYLPEINVRRGPDGGNELAVRDWNIGWFAVDDRPDFILEYRDETAWALLPMEMCHASVDKCWNRATPQELIGVLWVVGVLK
jgi:hypothetical protein